MMKKLMFCGLLLQNLYQLGARIFWIHNTGPIGCLPYSVIYYPPKPANKDQNGCVKSHNLAKEQACDMLQQWELEGLTGNHPESC